MLLKQIYRYFFPACVALILCMPVMASENHKKLKALQQRIKSIQVELTTQEKTRKDAADALQQTEQSISSINQKLAALQRDQQSINEALKGLTKQYDQAKNDLALHQNRLNILLYQQYTKKDQNGLSALLNQQDLNHAMRHRYYLKELSLARSEYIEAIQNSLIQLRTLADTINKKKEATDRIRKEYAAQREKLMQEKAKHKTIHAQISHEIAQQHNEINKLTQDEQRISQLVSRINKTLKQETKDIGLYNTRLPSLTGKVTDFKSLKGHLNLPVRGKLINHFGKQRNGSLTWRGLFISASQGSDVKAIANGRVVFADWLRGFGNLLIIEHNQNYMSLYGNNETLYKQVGETVSGGDTIASVGNSGGNPDSGLYFELRHNGKAFDPLTWIKIE